MTAYTGQTQTTLGQMRTALWDSQSRWHCGTPNCDTAWIRTRVSVVMPLALRCSTLDRCATREPITEIDMLIDDSYSAPGVSRKAKVTLLPLSGLLLGWSPLPARAWYLEREVLPVTENCYRSRRWPQFSAHLLACSLPARHIIKLWTRSSSLSGHCCACIGNAWWHSNISPGVKEWQSTGYTDTDLR
jgi:hypothetical protein